MNSPDDEQLRLKAIRQYALLDTPLEAGADDMVRLAAMVCGTPMAFIAVLDERREWLMARLGLELMEAPREHAFCVRARSNQGLTVVEDARLDARLLANPMVSGSPGVRFYAGAPLRSPEGHFLGALCVLDTRPGVLPAAAAEALTALARQVMVHFEARRAQQARMADPRMAEAAGGSEVSLLAAVDAALRRLSQPELSTDRLLMEAAEGARELTQADTALLMLRDDERTLTRCAGAEASHAHVAPVCDAGFRESLLVAHCGEDARIDPGRAATRGVGSLVAVPLVLEGARGGMLEVSCARAHAFGLRELRLMQLLAHGAGVALARQRAVTGLATALEDQQRSEALFRSAFEDSPIGHALLNPDGQVLRVNPAMCELLGRDERELVGQPAQAFTWPGAQEWGPLEDVRALVQGERSRTQFERQYVRGSGELLSARMSLSLIRDATGAPLHFLLQLEDASAATAAMEAAKQRAELLEAVHDAIMETDFGSKVLYWNRAAEQLYGWRSDEVLGQNLEAMLRTQYPGGLEVAAEEFIRTGRWEGELVQVDRAGRELVVSSRWSLRRDADGRPHGALAVNRDVTARRQALDDLLRQKQEFRRLIDTLPDAVLIVRSERVLYANTALATLLRFAAPEHMVGGLIWELAHPREREMLVKAAEALLGSIGTSEMRELRFLRHDGEEMLLEVAPLVLESFEGGPALLLLGRDLSERRKLQERLVLADRMASVGTLAAGVAHEINNPLSFVIGNLTYLNEELRALSDVVSRDRLIEPLAALADASQGADRVRLIVRDLHTFSRVDEAQKGRVDVRDALESCIAMTANVVRHRAQLVRDFRDVSTVWGNEARLGQVFVNLLVNAAHAIPEEPSRECAHQIRVRTRQREGWVVVEVEDSGRGIAPHHRGRIFDPFFTTKPVGQGTGLGLSICHGIVSAMGGKIEVESELGRGTCFRVLLPVHAGAEAPIPLPSPAGPPLRGRVLVLDDEAHVGALVRRLLGAELEVVSETSAQQALARIANGERFDAMLCDVMMPEMGGADVRAEVARLSPTLAGRILFMTGGAFSPRAQGFLDGLPEGFLTKPFELQQLRARLRSLVGGREGSGAGSQTAWPP